MIYGAGNMGRNCIDFINSSGKYNINCFLDRNARQNQKCMDYPVYRPDDERLSVDLRKSATVVLALFMDNKGYNDLQDNLRSLGYSNFVNATFQLGLNLKFEGSALANRGVFAKEASEIEKAFNLMTDEHSQQVFFSIFYAHAKINYNLPTQSPGMTQYFDVNVPFRNKYNSFVDCGAYTGDTLIDLAKHHKVENYFGFEPDVGNFEKLSQQTDALNSVNRAVLFPMGVSDENKFLRFCRTAGGASSRIDETGDDIIQISRLDDLLKGYGDLMIKMDVEGAEIAALNGAKKIITDTKPDLAICIYHKVSDLWQIPLILKEWVPQYSFYMRNHCPNTMETVLYATVISERGEQ